MLQKCIKMLVETLNTTVIYKKGNWFQVVFVYIAVHLVSYLSF